MYMSYKSVTHGETSLNGRVVSVVLKAHREYSVGCYCNRSVSVALNVLNEMFSMDDVLMLIHWKV